MANNDVENDDLTKNSTIVERINLMNVPLDIVEKEQLPIVINKLLSSKEAKNIVILSLWDFLRARRNNEYRSYIMSADLIIPISKSLVGGARFLTGKKLIRYMPFNFIIMLLSTLENRDLSMYLIGGRQKMLEKAEHNVGQTFPNLSIVGRHNGYYKKHIEPAILEAIRKASPSILLVGRGVHGKELWIHRNSGKIGKGLRLWCSNIYAVFSNKKKHPSDYSFNHCFEWIGYCLQNPLYIFRIFPYLYYKLLLLGYKLFKNK
jgi:N-acetylglucosaminyldiphosphoundecaprenol N-acetyl-beta-D-mannosaminyltransferase